MLLDRYETTIFNTAYRIVGDRDDAADVTQAVFVKVYRKINSFNPTYKFFSWLYRITLNEAFNFLAKKRPFDEVDTEIPSTAPGPEEDLHLVEMSDRDTGFF